MSILKFSDGEEFDTSGPPRLEQRKDGWYVLGKGQLIPVKDIEEGVRRMRDMRSATSAQSGARANSFPQAKAISRNTESTSTLFAGCITDH